MAFDLGSVVAKIDADISGFKKGMAEADHAAGGFSSRLQTLGDGISNFGRQASIMAGVVATGLGVTAKLALDSAAKFEQYQIAYTTLLKDEKKAAAAIAQIEQDAAKTPFELAPLVMANQRLISAGISAQDARKDILNLGDAISATGGGGAELERLSTNLQQIKAVGKASALDIKQFAFAGINVYDMLAKSTGKTVAEVREMDVTYEVLSKSFEMAAGKGGLFHEAMLKQSKTFNGLISTFKDVVSLGLKDILMDSGMFDALRNGLAALIPLLENKIVPAIVGFFDELKKGHDSTNQFVQIIMKVVDIFMVFVGWVQENQELVITFLKGLAVAFGALLIVGTIAAAIALLTNPLVLVALAIAALYTAWSTNFLGIRDIVTAVVTEIVNFWTNYLYPAISAMVTYFMSQWQYLRLQIEGVWKIIIGIIQIAWAIIYGLIKIGLALLTGDWRAAWDAVVQMVSTAWSGVKNIFEGIISFIKGWGGQLLSNLTKPFRDAWDEISKIVDKIKGALDFTKRHSPSVLDIVKNGVGKVNDALGELSWGGTMNANAAGVAVSSGGNQANTNIVQISLDGAMIADAYGAGQMAEILGDQIIKRLQNQVRV